MLNTEDSLHPGQTGLNRSYSHETRVGEGGCGTVGRVACISQSCAVYDAAWRRRRGPFQQGRRDDSTDAVVSGIESHCMTRVLHAKSVF